MEMEMTYGGFEGVYYYSLEERNGVLWGLL